jgi:tetratricopeptide (TPR) repeat protein
VKKIAIFVILFSPLLFIQSNILAQSITFAPDDPVLENELVKKRGEAGSQLFDTGIEFYQKKEYSKSIEYLLKVLAINPDDYEANTFIGMNYAEKGDFKKAVEYYQKATNAYPKQMVLIAGTAGFSPEEEDYRKNFYKTIEDYKKEIANNPNDYQVYNDLGYLSFVLRVDSKFTDYYKKSIAIKPDYAQAHYNLAFYYLFNEDKKLALEECKILEKLDKRLAKVIIRTIELAEKNKADNS